MNEQVVILEELIANKKPILSQLGVYIKKLQKQSQTFPLQKKSILVITLTKSFNLSCKLWLQELQKFKHEIFYPHFLKTKEKRVRNTTTGKKRQSRVNYQKINDIPKLDLSFEEMVKKMDESNQTHISIITPRQTPKKEAVINDTKEPLTLPPFDESISSQIAEEIASMMKSHRKPEQKQNTQEPQSGWKPDLQAYKNILEITPNQAGFTSGRKRMSRTKPRNEPRMVQVADKKIQISQGDERLRQLELLTTKIKISKEKQAEHVHYFSNIMQKVNPLLTDNNYIVSRIVLQKSQIPKINEEQTYSPMFQIPLNFFSTFQYKPQVEQKDLYVNLEDNASVSQQLQAVIKSKIDSQLFLKPQVSFQKFSEDHHLPPEIKGELFFQLLHTDYHLIQDSPEHFGDIKILK